MDSTPDSYDIRGLKFKKSDLDIIKLKDLEQIYISSNHLFYMSAKFGKPFLMLRAGDVVTKEFIQKYKEKGFVSFYALPVCDREQIDLYKGYLQKLKTQWSESDILETRTELITNFKDTFVNNTRTCNSLDLFVAYFEQLANVPDEYFDLIINTNEKSYARALQLGAFNVVFCILMGYCDYYFLRDVYNVSFLLDCALYGPQFTYTISQATELERMRVKGGLGYLKKKSTEREQTLFESHGSFGSQKAIQEFGRFFHYPEVLDVIGKHHEKRTGNGFPLGIGSSELADWESIVILSDFIIPHEDKIFSKGDGNNLFWDYIQLAVSHADFEVYDFKRVVNKILTLFTPEKTKELEEERAG